MKKTNKYIKNILIIIVCLLIEIILSNWSALSLTLSGSKNIDLDFNDAVITAKGKITNKGSNNIFLPKGGIVKFENINTQMRNICITLNGKGSYIPVNVSFTDENFSYSDGYDYNTASFQLFNGEDKENYINLSSYGDVNGLRLDFDSSTVTITSIEINAKPGFTFSIFRFCIMIAICFAAKYRVWEKMYRQDKHAKYIYIVAASVCLILVVSFGYITSQSPHISFLKNYPNHNISSADQYEQLFDAFHKGQLNLDIDYDISNFQDLDNVYDRSERNEYNLHGSFWDRAYYDGKFYSYFGVAPVFTVYFPVYMLTGCVPTAEFASLLLCIYSVIFISLLYKIILNKMCDGAPLILVIMGQATLLFVSGIFAVMAENMFYYMALLSGIGWVAAFLYFLLSAYYTDTFKKRVILLIFTGISVVGIVASRPTLLVYALLAIIPAVSVFGNKKENKYNKLMYAISIASPVFMGAVLIMAYNYSRFGNPLEFGFNYQLTVSIAKANTITLSMVPATIYHYFLQQPKLKTSFPFIEIKTYALGSYSRFSYLGRTLGVLSYPIVNGIFLYPFAANTKSDKKDKVRQWFIPGLIIVALFLSFLDMCKAGSHYRYTTDILFTLTLSALIIIFNLISKVKSFSEKYYKYLYVFTAIIMAVSISLGYLMIFANESKYLMEEVPFFVEMIRNF